MFVSFILFSCYGDDYEPYRQRRDDVSYRERSTRRRERHRSRSSPRDYEQRYATGRRTRSPYDDVGYRRRHRPTRNSSRQRHQRQRRQRHRYSDTPSSRTSSNWVSLRHFVVNIICLTLFSVPSATSRLCSAPSLQNSAISLNVCITALQG